MNRRDLIHARLMALQPSHLTVIDQSAEHAGHAGALQSGGGHFRVEISAADLQGMSKVAAHQKVYALIQDLIPSEIHAISIRILS